MWFLTIVNIVILHLHPAAFNNHKLGVLIIFWKNFHPTFLIYNSNVNNVDLHLFQVVDFKGTSWLTARLIYVVLDNCQMIVNIVFLHFSPAVFNNHKLWVLTNFIQLFVTTCWRSFGQMSTMLFFIYFRQPFQYA